MATLTIRGIDDTDLHRLKIRAAQLGATMKECVTIAIDNYLNAHDAIDAELAEDAKLVTTGWSGPPLTDKPAVVHAANCKCFICKPPKDK